VASAAPFSFPSIEMIGKNQRALHCALQAESLIKNGSQLELFMARDLVKTGSFAALHFSVGFGVTYALTGSIAIATGVALIEPAVNTVVFFLHERVWQRLGRRSQTAVAG
jgi:uncharacterized membrane protein